MGCASSKNNRCRHCRRRYSPVVVRRSNSMHVHHPAQHNDDSYHVVALTSSTLGSLKLGSSLNCQIEDATNMKKNYIDVDKLIRNEHDHGNILAGENKGRVAKEKNVENRNGNFDLREKLTEAKVWSSMMNEKIPKLAPKTPTMTPPGEPETINMWELMEGLEDVSPLRSPNHLRSFSFNGVCSPTRVSFDLPKSRFQEHETVKPMWLQMQETDQDLDCKITDFDPEIISSFRKSLQDLPSDHPFHIRVPEIKTTLGMVLCDDNEDEDDDKAKNFMDSDYRRPSFSKNKVILYFTSLRGIRKTYEDCCHVRGILKSVGVRVDERDVSMHLGFKDELKELLGERFSGNGFTLPRVFLGKKCIGGAEEIRKLNEDGKLEKLLEGCEMVEDGVGGGYECEACGDIRFMPCDTCNGSCKVYYECDEGEKDEGQGVEERGEEGDYGFQRCPNCNENGLIRCPSCCD